MAIAEVQAVEPQDPTENMHPAVRLLLRRMDTDPNEFVGSTRWEKIMAKLRDLASIEERNAIFEKYRLIQMDEVHVEIMRVLTHADDPEPTDDAGADAMGLSAKHHQQQQAKMQAQQALLAQQDRQMQHAMQQMGLGGYGYAGNQANQQSAIQQANAQDLARNLGLAGPGVPVRLMPSYEDVMAGSKPMGVLDSLKQFGLDLAGKPRK